MIDKLKQRENRGFITEDYIATFNNISFKEKVILLRNTIATERTMGAFLLKEHPSKTTVTFLIDALAIESKLYTKIEICNTLANIGELAINPLIDVLGSIGHNQHKKIPKKAFAKKSYPLPRDIACRTLCKIGKKAMPKLLIALEKNNTNNLSELIDAIGHIHFYHTTEDIFKHLKNSYKKNQSNDLIKWKIIRAFSGIKESFLFLTDEFQIVENYYLKREIERSLKIIEARQ